MGLSQAAWAARCPAQPPVGLRGQSTSPALCRGHSSPTACTPSSACSPGLPSLTDTIRKENKLFLACCLLCPMCWLEARPPNRCQNLEKKVQRGFISLAKFCPLWRNRNVVSILFPFQPLVSFSNSLFRVKCSVLGLRSEMISFIFPYRNCEKNTKWSGFGVWGA